VFATELAHAETKRIARNALPCVAAVAGTDPNEQESVVPVPEPDTLRA
jgi:hypothetical protein